MNEYTAIKNFVAKLTAKQQKDVLNIHEHTCRPYLKRELLTNLIPDLEPENNFLVQDGDGDIADLLAIHLYEVAHNRARATRKVA